MQLKYLPVINRKLKHKQVYFDHKSTKDIKKKIPFHYVYIGFWPISLLKKETNIKTGIRNGFAIVFIKIKIKQKQKQNCYFPQWNSYFGNTLLLEINTCIQKRAYNENQFSRPFK